MVYFIDTKSWPYQKHCLLSPIQPSAVGAIIFSALDVFQGVPLERVIKPRALGTYFGGLYMYNAMQCPMEAFHGRPSLLHNIISGGTLGYLGVASGRLGVPFVSPEMLFYRYGIRPEFTAFAVYGGMAGLLAGVLGSKRF